MSKSSADRHSSWYKRWFLGSPAAAALRVPTLTEADIFGGHSISLKGKMKKKRKKNPPATSVSCPCDAGSSTSSRSSFVSKRSFRGMLVLETAADMISALEAFLMD